MKAAGRTDPFQRLEEATPIAANQLGNRGRPRTDLGADEYLLPKETQVLKTFRIGITSLALTVLLLGPSGCRRPGAAERAGKKIDQTVEKVGQQVEKAGKQIDTTVKKIRNEVQGK